MTSSPDELVDSVYYYPNGQQKRVVTNGGDYITLYEYDDQGNKFKTTYIKNTGRSSVRYVYNIFGTQYEYNDNDGIFNLKEVTLGGAKRIGVYKQDADGLAISVGHAVYELTDHLGNVRVTFKNNAGNIQVLSRADYYAWGGQMPGRIWQQEDYRYGYQGQEKSQDQTTWDNFELRAYNHDLGRWSAPDPYAQFASPYLAMGNNPVTFVDPDGGYSQAGPFAPPQTKQRQWMSPFAVAFYTQRGALAFAETSISSIVFGYSIDGPESFGGGGVGGGSSYLGSYEAKYDSWWNTNSNSSKESLLGGKGKVLINKIGNAFNKIFDKIRKNEKSESEQWSIPDGSELLASLNGDFGLSIATRTINPKSNVKNSFDIDKSIEWLINNAHPSYKDAKGECAKYVRKALQAGGLNTTGNPVPAWEYATFLPKLGFTVVNTTNFIKGDIAVIQGYPGATADPKTGIPYGHIQMFDGNQWISDFKQNRPFWPGGAYSKYQPAFQIFRWEN